MNIISEIENLRKTHVAHGFILTLNIKDFAYSEDQKEYLGIREFLCKELSKNKNLVLCFSISRGYALFYDGSAYDEKKPDHKEVGKIFHTHTQRQPMSWKNPLPPQKDLMPLDILADFEFLLHLTETELKIITGITVIIENAEYLAPSSKGNATPDFEIRRIYEMLLRWGNNFYLLNKTKNKVVLLAENRDALFQELLSQHSGYKVIQLNFPEEQARKDFIEKLNDRELSNVEKEKLSQLTTGLRLLDLGQLLKQAPEDIGKAIELKKREVVESFCHGMLEFTSSNLKFGNASAQPKVRDYLKQLAEYDKMLDLGKPVPFFPKGILFVGVPGNGKSHLAKAYSNESGRIMLQLKNIRSMWVGETERNLNMVLDVLPQLGKVIVFIDEIDQVLSSRGGVGENAGSHEVERHMLAKLLAFMADNSYRGKILWIGATNRPDLIDMAMMRRFDRIIPFMNPSLEGRIGLLKDILKIHNFNLKDLEIGSVAELLKGFTCDAIEKIILRAAEINFIKNPSPADIAITKDSFTEALFFYKSNHDERTYRLINLKTIEAMNFISDLLWSQEEVIAAKEERSGTEIPGYILDLLILSESYDGKKYLSIDKEKLAQQIAKLSR